MARYPADLTALIGHLKHLPGIGGKTAERLAFHLLSWPSKQLEEMGKILSRIQYNIDSCPGCGCLREKHKSCTLCDPSREGARLLCLIASARDAFVLEETHTYKGLYHVLGGLISPMHGNTSSHIPLDAIKKRIHDLQIQEIIIALDSTFEGDATALFLKETLQAPHLLITRLAFGLPMGSSLDFVDGSTLGRALIGRQSF